MVTCLIQSTSATITLDDGATIMIPRRANESPQKTAAAVGSLLCVDRFDYALTPRLFYDYSNPSRIFDAFPLVTQ